MCLIMSRSKRSESSCDVIKPIKSCNARARFVMKKDDAIDIFLLLFSFLLFNFMKHIFNFINKFLKTSGLLVTCCHVTSTGADCACLLLRATWYHMNSSTSKNVLNYVNTHRQLNFQFNLSLVQASGDQIL